MSQFFISCKQSRIENNRSFYGCFYLGPFEPSQSLTIANALRRTLLSELYGLGIVSVEIEGASHEYSSLPGVRDSVLDILLNLKEIVLKKTIKNLKPQIGYLRARGPGVVRASHLRLPPFIQCVDPDQYIATLADNGFLNMKFIIQYGNKWLSPFGGAANSKITNIHGSAEEKEKTKKLITKKNSSPCGLNLHLKKRRLLLKKLKQIGFHPASSNTYINMFARSAIFLSKYTKQDTVYPLLSRYTKGINRAILINKKYPGINLRNNAILKKDYRASEPTRNIGLKNKLKKYSVGTKNIPSAFFWQSKKESQFAAFLKPLPTSELKKEVNNKKTIFLNANPLTIDAVFNPINKVNYIIEMNEFKTSQSKMQSSYEISELYEMLKNSNLLNSALNSGVEKRNLEKDLKDFMQNQLVAPPEKLIKSNSSQISNDPQKVKISEANQQELEQILEIKREISALKKDTNKHNITLEIWTNGSIHPRDAFYQGLKNLIKLFASLKQINVLENNDFLQKNKEKQDSSIEINKYMQPLKMSLIPENSLVLKKIKMGEITSTLLQDFLPLNDASFLSTYVSPKLKNYYLNSDSLSLILKKPFN